MRALALACALGCYSKPPRPSGDPCDPQAEIPDEVTISGVLSDATAGTPIADATVRASGMMTRSNASGEFALTQTAQGEPWFTFVHVDPVGDYDAHEFHFQRPFVQSETVLVDTKLTTQVVLDGLYAMYPPRRSDRATVLVSVTDCMGVGVEGLRVETDSEHDGIAYVASQTDGTGPSGGAYVLNALPGRTTFQAGETTFTVDVAANTHVIARMLHE